MKKITILLILFSATLPVFSQQEGEVKSFLENVYREVKSAGREQGDYEPLVEKYCSRTFRELYGETRRWENMKKEVICGSGGGAYDVFVQCQDYFEELNFTVSNVLKISDTPQERYSAVVTKHFYCSEYDEKEWKVGDTVFVVREDNEWRIEDSPTGEYSTACMKKHLPQAVDSHTNSDTQHIATRLEGIYKEVRQMADAGEYNTTPLCRKYCSKKFKELHDEVSYWEEKLGEMIVGQDCWIRTQDWDKLGEHKISDIKITGPSTATACVTATYIMHTTAGEKAYTGKTLLSLVCENDEWVIDDFTDYNSEGGLCKESDSHWLRKGIQEALEQWSSAIEQRNIWWKENNK